nr:restriction endonuclease [Actinomycetota bacterium]
MSDLASLLAALDRDALTRGTQFERICKWLLASAPEYRLLLEEVWLWKDWPGRKGSRETGIDLVARAFDGRLWAIQAKAYHRDYYVTKQDLDSFLSASARQQFSFRLLISTTDHIGANARDVLAVQEKPVHALDRTRLESLDLDWPAHPDDLRPRPPLPQEPRPHQREAIDAAVHGSP